ncbi:arsenate reductase [Vulcaniibacterium gelatinicum]|uniref:arsenate reductase n=1 Tax=Vulcaniibacterium gelatinicum TaxID=2598725 RepID=UPI0011CB619D|nr:arsenate reductase [Vulcaniibacterium gelatinicum]
MTTLYGLTNCDTCRKARNWLARFGIAHEFVDYREQRVAPETLAAWKEKLGGWEAMVNKASTTWRNLPPARKAPGSDAEWKLLLKEYPQLIRRPVVVTEDGVVTQGFSDNGFKKRFGAGAGDVRGA